MNRANELVRQLNEVSALSTEESSILHKIHKALPDNFLEKNMDNTEKKLVKKLVSLGYVTGDSSDSKPSSTGYRVTKAGQAFLT